MKIEAKKKKVVSMVDVVIIDGIEVGAYDFLGCLEALEGTDGAFTFVKISNTNVEKILLKYKLAYKNNRGSWAQHLNTGKIARFKTKIYKVLDELRKKDLSYYMNLQYEVKYRKLSKHDGGGWLAYIPQLGDKAYCADGETKKEALRLLNIIKKDLFEEFLKEGLNIPEPMKKEKK